MKLKSTLLALLCMVSVSVFALEDTFKQYEKTNPNESMKSVWEGFDPRAEPLDVEVLQEWEESGVVLKIVRFRALVHKGKKSMVAGVYGYPKGAKKLPALVQMHGGGQAADSKYIIENAKRGYATLSVAWAGRIKSSKYNVNSDQREAFLAGKSKIVTTDWGAVDGYHAPTHAKGTPTMGNGVGQMTLDKVPSSRNCLFFLGTVAGRRAITFLEQQPEVNPDKIGVYGHSMGGRYTVYIAGSDDRIKVAVPSCGGLVEAGPKTKRTMPAGLENKQYLENVKGAILLQAPTNDFYGIYDFMPMTVEALKNTEFSISSTMGVSHKHSAQSTAAGPLWIDAHLKGDFKFPKMPKVDVSVTKAGKILVKVDVDDSREFSNLSINYTQKGCMPTAKDDSNYRKKRPWLTTKVSGKKGVHQVELPEISGADEELWLYAQVTYEMGKDAKKYDLGTKGFDVSSVLVKITKEELAKLGVKATK